MNYVLGLDIGIASVGWGIIDLDTAKPVKYGVRLFTEADASNNAKRRTARGGRRLKRRKVNRINDLKKVLKDIEVLENSFNYLPNPYEIRKKGLIEKLTNDELCTALLHIAKRRGNGLEVVEDDENKIKENETTKITLNENSRLLSKGLFICEIQLQRLKERGYIHGNDNNFKTSDYVKEISKILSNQNLSEEQNKEIISCITRRREYYEGPGSEKSPTQYGRFIEKDGEIICIDLIEKMTGKCSIFKNELRAPKMSYSAELFNFLNDLNNLTIDTDRKISIDEKKDILAIIDTKGSITPKQLAKVLNINIEQIQGFRIDKKSDPIITEFKGYKKYINALKDTQPELLNDKKLLDNISIILTQTKGIEERKEKNMFFTVKY